MPFVIVDKDGSAVSMTELDTEVASSEQLSANGYSRIEVAKLPGPNDRWDPSTKKVVPLTEAELDQRDPRRVMERKRKDALARGRAVNASQVAKLDAILDFLETLQ